MTTMAEQPRIVRPAPSRAPILPPRPHWMDRGACKDSWDPVFVAETGDEEDRAQAMAEKYCDRCPVRVQCLALALKTKSPDVWAGTTGAQRRAMARTRTRLTCPVCRCTTLITVDLHDMCVACGRSWKTGRGPLDTELEPTDDLDDR